MAIYNLPATAKALKDLDGKPHSDTVLSITSLFLPLTRMIPDWAGGRLFLLRVNTIDRSFQNLQEIRASISFPIASGTVVIFKMCDRHSSQARRCA